MTTVSTTSSCDLGPISPDWTIFELLDWLTDDTRQHDESLRGPLAVIEASLTGRPWAGDPSTVALIRSLAAAVRPRDVRVRGVVRIAGDARHRGDLRIAELLAASASDLAHAAA